MSCCGGEAVAGSRRPRGRSSSWCRARFEQVRGVRVVSGRMRAARLLPAALLTALLAAAPTAQGATTPWYVQAGASWKQFFFTEPDGTTLHADVLHPAKLGWRRRTPVILSIGPYFNHSGQTGPAGPVEGTSYDQIGAGGPQPSDRFADFVLGAHVIQRGYTYVMVDLRGFGGSNGCLDWGGTGEQADVKNAVQWAASQPWSTGAVGMYGKSYDAVTGLIGEAQQPRGLRAIVAQEPVYDMYRYLYTNGVRFENSLATPALYDAIAATPGQLSDSPRYQPGPVHPPARPGSPGPNPPRHGANPNPKRPFWPQAHLIGEAAGHP